MSRSLVVRESISANQGICEKTRDPYRSASPPETTSTRRAVPGEDVSPNYG